MTYSCFDDASAQHPKARLAGNDAWSLWCAAIIYSNRYLTDGYIPLNALAKDCFPEPISLKKARELAQRCVDARVKPDGFGLFEEAGENLYKVHDFLDHNDSKSQVQSRRKKDRDRKRFLKDSSGNPGGKSGGLPPDSGPESADIPSLPIPSLPTQPRVPEARGSESTLGERAKLWVRDPTMAAHKHPQPETWPELRGLCDLLAQVFGGEPGYPRNSGDLRCRVPLARLAEDIPLAQLERAIRGSKQADIIREKPENQTLMTILRDSAQVDKYAKLDRSVTPRPLQVARPDFRPPPAPQRRLLPREAYLSQSEYEAAVREGKAEPANDPDRPAQGEPGALAVAQRG